LKVFYIYCITNLITNKKYIGKTVDPKRRWKMHQNCVGGCTALHNSIKKYGKENFAFEIIEKYESEIDAYKNEAIVINKLNTKIPNGYNITDGGIGFVGNKKTKEHIEKVANAHRGMKRSEETKKRISESKLGKKNPHAIKALEKAWISLKNKQKVKVLCNKLFDGEMEMLEASKKYNISYQSISKCINKKVKSAGKHPITNENLIWIRAN
jgi:group I intron endonuclease